jgi:light-regulated signal transduction histidine kinase (bacteriophytochrome)
MIAETTDINILKSTINNLTQELLESNKQLKIEDRKLRDFINHYQDSLETQIKNILGLSKLLSEHYESSQQLKKEHIDFMIPAIYRTALKLKYLTEDMKRDASRMESKTPASH